MTPAPATLGALERDRVAAHEARERGCPDEVVALRRENAALRAERDEWRRFHHAEAAAASAHARILKICAVFGIRQVQARALGCLLAAPGMPIRSAALLNASAVADETDPHYVVSLISSVRRAIGHDCIETCWGFGYRISAAAAARLEGRIAASEPKGRLVSDRRRAVAP